ncbi:MAG: ABC transporter substrate-binding protein [Mogibacterium sp.]|nr:ABC transporter substrate-binding protein [Mogibacterium sp.]MBR3377494.1 ABC transporter substrate-binding protein [Mogibacterium sp.]
MAARRNKNRSIKRLLLTAVLVMAVFVLSACSTWDSFRQTFITKPQNESVPTITIGVIEPQTGRYAGKGKDEIKGIELANSIYNNVDGYDVKLVKVDTQSTVAGTETAIQALIEMQPVAIIGAAGEASSLTISDYIDKPQIPTITPSASNPLITQRCRYYFRASLTESQMGEGLAEYAAEELGSRNIAVISIKNDTSTSALIDGFDERIKKIAGKRNRAVVMNEEILPNEEEMKQALMKLRYNAADVCFVSMGAEEMDTFFTLAEDMGLDGITYLGTRSWGDESFISMMDRHRNIKVVFPYESVLTKNDDTSDTYTEEAQRFQIEYANRYGADDVPSGNAALGYDSYLILINAFHNAKSTEGAAIRTALMELDELKCATGLFSFDDNGNVRRAVTLSTIKSGKPVTEYVTRIEAKAKVIEDIETLEEEESNNND